MAVAIFLDRMCLALGYAAKFDPFFSLDCARVEGSGGAIQVREGIKLCSVT